MDAKRYQQIARNLISNALKFTDEGEIRINLDAEAETSGHKTLVATFSDTGIGIPEDQVDFVFDRFTQLDASNTRKEGGTGLGLAICRRLCGLMEGEIFAESKVGRGTTFTVKLPLIPASAEVDSESTDADFTYFEADRRRVLIVDDDLSNLLYLKKVMDRVGVSTLTEHNPKEGLSIALSEKFDVIFLDLHMPEVSGMDIARQLRASGGVNQEVPLVAVTADVLPEQKKACLQSGFSRVLNKPVKPNQLREVIAEFA